MQNVGVEYQINRTQATGSYEWEGREMTYEKGAFTWTGMPLEFVYKLVRVATGAGDAAVQEALS